MSHVFISYVRDDSEVVDRLVGELKRAGIEVWLDREKIRPGIRWQNAIEEAIEDGAFFIACFSEAYSERDRTHMNEELTIAIEELRLRPSDRAWFIPVVLNKSTVPKRRIGGGEKLTDLQWVDLQTDWNEGISKIVSVILDESLSDGSEMKPDMIERARTWKRAERLSDQLLDPTSSVADRRYAANELKSMSFQTPIAISAFRKAVDDDDETVRKAAIEGLAVMGSEATDAIVEALKTKDEKVRDIALNSLTERKTELNDVFSDLIDAFEFVEETSNKLSMSDVLAAIGASAVPALLDAMKSRDKLKIKGAANALCKMSSAVEPSAPEVFDALNHENQNVRAAAVQVTSSLLNKVQGIDIQDVIVSLAHAIKDKNTRWDAWAGLRSIGNRAFPAVPVLIEILRMPVDELRSPWNNHIIAKKALAEIGPSAITALEELLQDRVYPEDGRESEQLEGWYQNYKTRYSAVEALGMILSKYSELPPCDILLELVEDPEENNWIKREIAIILAYRGVKTSVTKKILIMSMKEDIGWDYLSQRATVALGEFSEAVDEIVPLLIECLQTGFGKKGYGYMESACRALGKLGSKATSAKPALTEALLHEDNRVRSAAMEALDRIDPKPESIG